MAQGGNRPDRPAQTPDEAAREEALQPFHRAPILIVDDEKPITDTLERYFTLEGYDVRTANNPYVALRTIHRENILVVISDIAMPGMTGVELLQRIKQYNGMVQVIMITGYVTLDNILSCLRLGADDCFIKPITDLEALRRAVDEATAKLRKWHDLMVAITQGR
jgi:DNA-binding NtrC family response regulator